eukprot:6726637-Pyramimonas_sp.AAC.1
MVAAQSGPAAAASGEVAPMSKPRAQVRTSASRSSVPGTRPWASSSAPGSQTMAASCARRATAWSPPVDSARLQHRARDPA